MQESYGAHYSVLNQEVIEHLVAPWSDPGKRPCFADLTFGGGGHSLALLRAHLSCQVLAVDQDQQAIANGIKLLEEQKLADRCRIIHCNFSETENWAATHPGPLAGVIMDLGVSSHHFDSPERGFSFREDGPLDMRMDQNSDTALTAETFVNEFSEKEIADVIFQYGEERLSRRIARQIIEARKEKRITTTKELENLIFHAYPAAQRHGRTHPATRSFQAIRIYINQELAVLESTLLKLPAIVAPGGRIAVISFHSLEDRIVKHRFKEMAEQGLGVVLTKKPILPEQLELNQNSRSRSAKLRVFEIKKS